MDDVVEEVIPVNGRDLRLLRPRDAEALLDEHAFEHEEYLPYWAELWPSSLALARAIGGRALKGARTLELGCGLGLPSIAAALAGGRVLATDWSSEAIRMTETNAERNGAMLETLVCSWTEPAPAARARAVGPRARLRRPLRGPQRRSAARRCCRGSAATSGSPTPAARPPSGSWSAAREIWTVEQRRAPELVNGAVYRLRQPVAT